MRKTFIVMQKRFSNLKHTRLMVLWLSGVLAAAALPAGATQNVALAWNPSTNPNVAGYNIYYSTVSGHFTNMVSVGDVTNATVSGLLDGTTYYFAAKARSASGVESDFSNETSYAVPSAAASLKSAVRSRGQFSFTINGVPRYRYVVQASTNMVNWVSVATNTAPFQFVDPNAGQFKQRFYRAIYLP
jgi:Fibronectin type III domain